MISSRIQPDRLSSVYRTVDATSVDPDRLYALYSSNQYYFAYFGMEPGRERLRLDMTMRPDGCSPQQKHFIAYCMGEEPIAILDLIEGYPDRDTCYIGLFMVHDSYSGRGIGNSVISELCAALQRLGFSAVRLAYGKDYTKAAHFWTKNGFVPLREALHEEYGNLIVAERRLVAPLCQ